MVTLLVINPVSGDRDKKEFIDIARNRLVAEGHEVVTFTTTGKDDRRHLEEKIAETKPDRILSIGGDGTFMLVASSAERAVVGIIPMGSSNGLASELQIPQDPVAALDLFLREEKQANMDAIEIMEGRCFLHIGDVGLNATVVKGFEEDPSRGLKTYFKHFLRALNNSKPFHTSVSSKGETLYEGEAIMVGIGNGRRFGSGLFLDRSGNPFDGKFEVVILKSLSPAAIIERGLATINESFSRGDAIEQFSVEAARIAFDQAQILQLDGEIVGSYSRIDPKIVRDFVTVILPGDNPYV
jgi:diacylglycerol kinase family enzyme